MLGFYSPLQSNVSSSVFHQLCQLLQEFGQALPDSLILTDQAFAGKSIEPRTLCDSALSPASIQTGQNRLKPEFVIIWATAFKALLCSQFRDVVRENIAREDVGRESIACDIGVGTDTIQGNVQGAIPGWDTSIPIVLTFDGTTIVEFVQKLSHLYSTTHGIEPGLRGFFDRLHLTHIPNQSDLQSKFTLQLIEQLTHSNQTVVGSQNLDVDPVFDPALSLGQRVDADPMYRQLQLHNQVLERRLQDYAQELRSALMAAQTANLAKSEFLATMSHELRTPLACVIGMSSTLLHWSLGSLNQRQRNYLQTIHDSGKHLMSMINDILEFSQLQATRTMLEISQFSITRIVHACEEMFREQAESASIDLKSEIHLSGKQDILVADARRVQQILINLISNAIKFTPAQGRVILRVWRENSWAAFQIEDTGIGIDEANKELLFQKFQQLDTSLQRQYNGAGLGLALTKQLVELHNGRIHVESEMGHGSTFTVRLPSQSFAQIKSPALSSSIEELPAQGQIVLLEDDEETAVLICEVLTAVGYQVIWLVDSSTAIDQIQFLKPIAVIINLDLAHVGSHEMLGHLRRSSTTASPKLLALASPEKITQVTNDLTLTQADAYLCKPLEADTLITSLSTLTKHTD